MNYRMVVYLMGWVLNIEAFLMLLPCAVSLLYRDGCLRYFLPVIAAGWLAGWLCVRRKPKNTVFYAREGMICVALVWICLSLTGALPFWLSGQIPAFYDAMFEVISGFTTTGASILTDVEALSPSMLMWRSFTHWIGGMGILVFMLAILPLTAGGGYSMYLMKAESPGPSVGKMTPKIRNTAKILYTIYLAMTLLQIVLLLLGGMPLFDSLCVTFGSAGTGGFGIKNDSMASYTVYQQAVTTTFMILFGVNFNVYYLFLIRRFKDGLRCEEMRVYLAVILAAVLCITWNIRGMFPSLFSAFHHAAFQVASIITTTGYSTVDFEQWPQFSKTILIGLMLIGACAGSTGGGMKISRLIIGVKEMARELYSSIHPRSVRVLRFEGKAIEHQVIRSVNAFFAAYFVIFAVSVLLVSLDNFDFTTNFTAVAATFNNIGPGLSQVGPMSNFSQLSVLSKCVLMFDMLAGRLEIFPLLILFLPSTWKK